MSEATAEQLQRNGIPTSYAHEIVWLRAEVERLKVEAGTLVQRIAEGIDKNKQLCAEIDRLHALLPHDVL